MSTSPAETERRAASSVLCFLLHEVAAVLLASPEFAAPGTEILTEDKGDLDTEIAQAIANMGLAVTVMFSAASGGRPTLAGPVFDSVQLVCEIAENALINRGAGGRCALETADLAARVLHQADLGHGRRLLVERLAVYPAVPEGASVCYHVDLRLQNISLVRKAR